MAARKMHLLGFMMYTPINHMTLSWADPEDRQVEGFGSMEHWQGLARTMERGRFDGLFFADVPAVYDFYKDTTDVAVRHGVSWPAHDPVALIGVMASGDAASRHCGDRLRRQPAPVPHREVALQPRLPDRRPGRVEHRDRQCALGAPRARARGDGP